MLKSLALKFIYGFVAGILGILVGWVNANPDPGAWTLVGLKTALLVGGVALVKKLITNIALN